MFLDGIVTLKQGMIKGTLSADGKVAAFKGIPYAAPPTGRLRWKLAQPLEPFDGVLDCTNYGPSFTQVVLPMGSFYQKEFYPTARPMSEDSGLNLNVWSPAKSPQDKLPIFVWIHGGGFVEGSGAALQFIGEALARKGVVVVTINYRVGAFGFMSHPQLTQESGFSGNYGFSDMMEALRFIKENAQCFGGDPENITIDGQSAGSMSVLSLIASKKAEGLFQRAIAQSGSVFGRIIMGREEAEQQGVKLMEALGAKDIDEMRLIPSVTIMKKAQEMNLLYRPIVDGLIIEQPYDEIFRLGLQNKVSLIAGSTDAEGCLHEPQPGDLNAHLEIAETYGDKKDEFLALFPAGDDVQAGKLSDAVRTASLFAGMKRLAKAQRDIGCEAYLYCFDQVLPAENGRTQRAFHSAELVYQFGTLDTGWRPWEKADYMLSDQMMEYYANYARTGDPNGGGLPVWEKYADGNGCMRIGEKLSMGDLPYEKQVAWLEKQLG